MCQELREPAGVFLSVVPRDDVCLMTRGENRSIETRIMTLVVAVVENGQEVSHVFVNEQFGRGLL